MKDIKALTGIRGFASVWVCVHHYAYSTLGAEDRGLPLNFLTQGHWGVIIFFVLSGFILSYVYASWFTIPFTSSDYLKFIKLRIARVYPLHLATLIMWLIACLLGFIGLNSNDSLYTFVLNLLLVHAWGFTPSISWNQPSWSISAELFSYLIFPLFYKWLNHRTLIVCGIISSLLLLSILHPPQVWIAKQIFAYFNYKLVINQFDYGLSVITWFYSFAFGIVVYFQSTGRGSNLNPDLAVVAGLFITIVMLANAGALNGGETAMGISFTSGLVIYGIYKESRVGAWIFGNPISVMLGDISYSLYLTHIMYPLIINRLCSFLIPKFSVYDLSISSQLLVALLLSYLTYRYFERPARLYLRGKMY
jgi:peptidoglycan/LPS O-acetylase OafA/YrhL